MSVIAPRTKTRFINSSWLIPLAIVTIGLGIFAVVFPSFAALDSTLFFGLVFIFAGIIQIFYAFQSWEIGQVFWKLILGCSYLIAGIFVAIYPLSGIFTVFTLVLGIAVFVQGMIKISLSLQIHRTVPNWGWMLVSGIIGIRRDYANEFNEKYKSHATARLVDRRRAKVPVNSMGFSMHNRQELLRLTEAGEAELGNSCIPDWLSPSFFETEFWYMWATTFAFQPWHSAVEFKRYLHHFMMEFSRIAVENGDLVFLQNGSMTDASSLGSMTSAPKQLTKQDCTSWNLWEKLAAENTGFGHPAVFIRHDRQRN
jgi:uncharacterized membrane protein HdeD (DUF308 family)